MDLNNCARCGLPIGSFANTSNLTNGVFHSDCLNSELNEISRERIKNLKSNKY